MQSKTSVCRKVYTHLQMVEVLNTFNMYECVGTCTFQWTRWKRIIEQMMLWNTVSADLKPHTST